MKILVVDDHAINRKLLRVQLEGEGHEVIEAAHGLEALRRLEDEPLDAVISDILMPNMDGFRLCREIRRSEKFGALPFVMYTSTYDSPSDRELAHSVGADRFLVKPAPMPVILQALREALQQSAARARPGPPSPRPDESYVLAQYSEALVHKLEEKNLELQAALQESRRAHERILELNQDLQGRIAEREKAEQEVRNLNASLERRVAERTAELEAANRAKDAFLATMSHEVRTPLAGLMGMLELLALLPLEEGARKTLDTAIVSGKGLARIVDDILDWSKIEAGKLQLAPAPTRVESVVHGVVNTYAGLAGAKGLALSHRIDPLIAPALLVDALRLSQVLNNFVSNAIKFTASGEVWIRAELLERLDGTERVRFSVRDTGPGMDEALQQRLFRNYEQGSAETARMYGGTGLGLAICRRLADMMGGSIEVRSAPGQGSSFSVTLSLRVAPLAADAGVEAAHATASLVPEAAAGSSPLLLVVDDHPINRELLSRQLRVLGLNAETASSGAEALRMWREGRFDMVITDCQMADMDGYALAGAIRELEAAAGRRRTPIIAWTANALSEEEDRCRKAGMDDVLTKPAALARVRDMVGHWMPARAETATSAATP